MKHKRHTVVIVDDHSVLVAGLKMLLESEEDMEVVGTASNAQEALDVTRQKRPHCILLDISLPGKSGLDIIQELKHLSPQSRILILTMHEEQGYLSRALSHGANGFVLKKAMDVDLIYAIRAVLRGETYVDPRMIKEIIHERDMRYRDKTWEELSPREKQVLIGVARGYSNKEMADLYHLSEKTIATYRARACFKLGISKRSEIVRMVMEKGLLKTQDFM